MEKFPIIGTKVSRMYDLPNHGVSQLIVEAIDFFPCVDSWWYEPPYTKDHWHEEIEEKEMPAEWYGKDQTTCIVTLHAEDGSTYRKHISLVRSVRPDSLHKNNEVTWRTSCMVKYKTGISIGRNSRDNRVRKHRSSHDMLWELAGPDPITLLDNLEQLANEAYRLFENRMPNRI